MNDQRNSSLEIIDLALGWRTWEVGVRNEEHDQIKVEIKERRKIKENIEKNKERNKKNVKSKPSSPTQSDASKSATKKFDYGNKSKTKYSSSRARRAARGRSSSYIAK